MKYLFLIPKVLKLIIMLALQVSHITFKKHFEGKRTFKRMLKNYDIDKTVVLELSKEYLKLLSIEDFYDPNKFSKSKSS